MGEERADGLWAPQRRALTAGLVLTITFVASEALAVVTVMPVAAHDLVRAAPLRLGVQRVHAGQRDRHRAGRPGGGPARARGAVRGRASPLRRRACRCGPGFHQGALVAGRVLQGIGAGAIPSVAYAAIGRTCQARSAPG